MEKIIETKTCKHCGCSFCVTDKDVEFYEKVSPVFGGKKYNFPSPTLCPKCRQQRRLSFRNERRLYKRKSSATQKEIISTFHPQTPFTVYEQSYYWSDNWNAFDFAKEFDFSRSFFFQMRELMEKVPLIGILNDNTLASINCDYAYDCWYSSNCYFVTCAWRMQDCMYCSFALSDMKNCVDCTGPMTFLENCYWCIASKNLHTCMYLENSSDCNNCTLGFYLRGCSYCYGCINLSNKKYCIFNRQYTKEEYFKMLENRNLQDDTTLFEEMLKGAIYRAQYNVNCVDCDGDYLIDSKNVQQVIGAMRMQNCKFYAGGDGAVNCMDIFMSGECELGYENLTCDQGYMTRFSLFTHKSTNALYSQYCFSCKNIFGCIGLRNQEFCIFNKQYTQEEYEKIIPKIIEHMQKTGEWGEYFPANISAYGYNETMAQEYYPLEKNEAIEKGFSWSDYEQPLGRVDKIISADKLPKDISKIPDDILNWAIECEITKKPFRIIQQELEFYRTHKLPLPTKHPDQRHKERLKLRNLIQMNERNCSKCGAKVHTTIEKESPKKVYCEDCYNKEVF